MLATGGYVNIHEDIKYKSIITYKYIDMNNPYFHKVTLDATSGINYLYEIDNNSEVRDLPQIKSINTFSSPTILLLISSIIARCYLSFNVFY